MHSEGLAWIMLAPRCGRILGVLVCVDTRYLTIASTLVEGFVGIDELSGPYVGVGVRAGFRVNVNGWVFFG